MTNDDTATSRDGAAVGEGQGGAGAPLSGGDDVRGRRETISRKRDLRLLRVRIASIVALVAVAGAAQAGAQQQPPQPSPSASVGAEGAEPVRPAAYQEPGRPAQLPQRPVSVPLSALPMTTIDVVPTYIKADGGDETGVRGNQRFDGSLVDYFIQRRLSLNSRFSFYFRRQNIGSTNGSVPLANGRTLNFGAITAKIDREGIDYFVNPNLQVQLGYWHKWTACCPSSDDPTNPAPAYYNGPYLGAQLAFGPRTRSGRLFQLLYEGIDVLHTMNAYSIAHLPPAVRGELEGTRFIHRFGLLTSTTVGRGPGTFVPFLLIGQVVDYFDNFQPFPSRATAFDYGVRKGITRFFALQVDGSTLYSHRDGLVPVPNTIHHAELNVRAVFRYIGRQ